MPTNLANPRAFHLSFFTFFNISISLRFSGSNTKLKFVRNIEYSKDKSVQVPRTTSKELPWGMPNSLLESILPSKMGAVKKAAI